MLNNLENINKYDNDLLVAKSIELLPDQIRQVLNDSRLIKVPHTYSTAKRVVINGMGGSNLGARIIQTTLSDKLNIPLIIWPGYEVPKFVDKDTIFVISSFSGTTEEPLSVYKEVRKRKAKILVITEDSPNSKLKELMLKENIPGYAFDVRFNPSNQPRLGVGYTNFGTLVLLAKAGLITLKKKDIEVIIEKMELETRRLRANVDSKTNKAKQIAKKLHKKIPIFVASDHLIGNLHAIRNQTSENAKNFSDYLEIPELNHYTMEGLANPATNKKNLAFLFFESDLYHPRNVRRAELTKQVIEKQGIDVISHKLKGDSKLHQAYELLQFGTWITYYLGILNKVDPIKIPWVDWFKQELK